MDQYVKFSQGRNLFPFSIRNSTYALCNLFTMNEDVFYDTSTNDITDLHLADAITHRFFYLVEKLQQNNVIVVNTNSLLKKCILFTNAQC